MPDILLAEDHPADVYLIRAALEEYGIDLPILVAAEGQEVLRIISQQESLADTQLKRLHADTPLVDGPADIENGLALSVDLKGDPAMQQVGWRAKRHTGIIDIDQRDTLEAPDFWDQIHRLASDAREFDAELWHLLLRPGRCL